MATALELSRKEKLHYLKAARRQLQKRELTPGQRQEHERLMASVREAADHIKSRFGVRKVVLFGSLAHAGWFVSDSDVDLAVEGLAHDDYWEVWRVTEEIIKDRPVDLIDMETASDSLKKAIARYGLEL